MPFLLQLPTFPQFSYFKWPCCWFSNTFVTLQLPFPGLSGKPLFVRDFSLTSIMQTSSHVLIWSAFTTQEPSCKSSGARNKSVWGSWESHCHRNNENNHVRSAGWKPLARAIQSSDTISIFSSKILDVAYLSGPHTWLRLYQSRSCLHKVHKMFKGFFLQLLGGSIALGVKAILLQRQSRHSRFLLQVLMNTSRTTSHS